MQLTATQEAEESQRMQRELAAFRGSASGAQWAEKRGMLPVLQVKGQLLHALQSGHCAVLSGDTGCGKTTQARSAPGIHAFLVSCVPACCRRRSVATGMLHCGGIVIAASLYELPGCCGAVCSSICRSCRLVSM